MSENHSDCKRLLAVCGKGGTGKTALTALMTRVLLDNNTAGRLLLIDADPALGLPNALGIKVKRTMGQVREAIIRTARGGDKEKKAQLANMLDYMLLESIVETDRFALLAMGRTETLGCFCPVNNLMRDAIESLSRSFETIIIDGEAGVEQINRQVMRRVDTLIVVSDATTRGIQTAALIREMVDKERVLQCNRIGLVFNRVSGNEDILKQAAETTGLKIFGFVPQDENVAYHDLLGKPVFNLDAASPALVAVRTIVCNHIIT